MMPMRSFGRPSINFRVTSRIASTRVASEPPIVKSFVNIDPETSSTSIMSIPLASTCVRLLPSCGRASPTMNTANVAKITARKIFPARLALSLPIACRAVVDEKVSAAASPRFPRKYASNGMANNNKSSHGRTNVSAVSAGHQSNSRKMSSLYKAGCFFQQEPAVSRCRLVTRELDQVALVQKIFEQRFLVFGKRRRLGQRSKKFDRRLSRHRQRVLLGHVASKNVRYANAKPVGI